VASACDEEVPRWSVFVGQSPRMKVPSRHGVLVMPFEKISCPILLRTSMSREPNHRTLRTHHSSLFGWGTDVDLLRRCHYCWVVSEYYREVWVCDPHPSKTV
jgi:hypothetical protein